MKIKAYPHKPSAHSLASALHAKGGEQLATFFADSALPKSGPAIPEWVPDFYQDLIAIETLPNGHGAATFSNTATAKTGGASECRIEWAIGDSPEDWAWWELDFPNAPAVRTEILAICEALEMAGFEINREDFDYAEIASAAQALCDLGEKFLFRARDFSTSVREAESGEGFDSEIIQAMVNLRDCFSAIIDQMDSAEGLLMEA